MASGGKREGAGRKPLPQADKKVQMVITLSASSRDLLKALAREHNIAPGRFVEMLLKRYK